MVRGLEGLTEEERKALRGSKFAPLRSSNSKPSSSSSRIAHPGGPVATNKAVALAKFLERKLQEPGGLDSIKPELLELAVKHAKETVHASSTSNHIRHVTSFDDSENTPSIDEPTLEPKKKKLKKEKKKEKEEKKKQKKKNKKLKPKDLWG